MKKQNKNQSEQKLKTDWNLKLLYQSTADPQIDQDLKEHQEKSRIFAEKYQNRTDYLTEPQQLLTALKEYEQLLHDLQGGRPLIYFHYLTAINSNEPEFQARLNKITQQLTKVQNQLEFFSLKLGRVDPTQQKSFLENKKLKKYRYFLAQRFNQAQFDLPEKQEQILNLTQQTSYQMWTKGVEKAVNQLTVSYKNKDENEDETEAKQIPITKAVQKIPELPTKKRRQLHRQVLTKVSQVADFSEAEINAIITYKNSEDKLRGYKLPYQETVLGFENDLKTVQMMIELITKNFDIAHRFYKLKTKLLNQKKLTYADRSATVKKLTKRYNFKQGLQLLQQTFQKLDPEFAQVLEKMTNQGQLDVYPKTGKAGGAFCSSTANNPTFVLLNYTQDFNSITTFAHEMGHAIHSELSKSQPIIYQHYSPSTAETASAFFERFIFDELIKNFTEEEKIAALHNRLQDDVNTIFRQIALFNLELELHQKIEKAGYLSSQQIGALHNKHMSAYLGPNFKLTELDGLFHIIWPHIRYFFYSYTYAYGHLISKNLVQQVKTEPSSIKKVKQFLSAGGSDKPVNLFKNIDINITKPDFFNSGLKTIKKDLDRFEKLIKNHGY